jgi:hypothetical protein
MKLVEKSFLVAIEFAIKVQLKGLTHMFCVLMSSYKIFEESALSLDFTLKIICHLG